ncbi:MAG: tRNA lysidine(34) synthetase TilS [Desulfobulbaceae bacterium]|nr:tRNA lysidine(34) synthetase TilS [Desulfobulbaceae bacterium]
MHPLEKKIERLIRQEKLLARGDRLVLGVSAGPDSMALLHLLAALAPAWGWSLLAVYLDHGLRPGETAQEAALVREAAGRLGAGFASERVDVQGEAGRRGLSLEHSGRLLRYEVFARLAEGGGAKIVVAHTADEQAEEILLRLLRGTGRKGLAGMATVREGQVVRPLLTTAKEEVLAYLADRKIDFAVDSSNQDRRYLRNRVRLDLLPHLADRYNPNIAENLRQTGMILQDEEAFLAAAAERAWPAVVTRDGGEGGLVMALPQFAGEPRAIRRRLLETACWRCGQRPSFKIIGQLLELAEDDTSGSRLHLGGGLRVSKQGGQLIFNRPQGNKPLRGDLGEPAAAPFSVEIAGAGVYPIPEIGRLLVVELLASLPAPASLEGADWLDAELLSFPLLARSVRAGDRFRPLGAPGRKKVGDFFTDAKVARAERRRVVVVESAGRVAALAGYRIEHAFRVTAATGRVLKIRLQPL